MTAIQLLACAGMIVGVFLLLGMKPVEFTDSLFGFLLNPKRSLREDIRESSGRKKLRDFAQGTEGSTEHSSNDGQGEPVFLHLRSCSGTVLRWGIHCHFVREFFPGSGDGSGFFISAILVCETDCQSL